MCVKTRKVFSGIKKRKTLSLWERVIFAFVGKLLSWKVVS
jgi:hypothetical protein